ncbi:hypothetical protein KFE25_004151 [Diacronema lutheri]|uniref:Hexosyltransferase n=1 Tax=Diacronema lutheri TaxID=2081491 RepID=A0A8J5X719_DIALT|nr:hypothetical protein KFE25_004151 [Diacronema lutheri]
MALALPCPCPLRAAKCGRLEFLLSCLLFVGPSAAAGLGAEDALLVRRLEFLVALEPPAPINASCAAQPLPAARACTAPLFARDARELSRPSKIALMLLFNAEADSLEIALHEYAGVVHTVFLVEGTRTTRLGSKKALLWEQIQRQARFDVLRDNVVHIVFDDAASSAASIDVARSGNGWVVENAQTAHGWRSFLRWNAATRVFADHDVFISADTDEIMSREALHELAGCRLHGPVASGGLWMPQGSMARAFRPDWPASHAHPYAFGMPTIYRMAELLRGCANFASKACAVPGRQFGRSNMSAFLLGGMHLTHYTYLPHVLLKKVTTNEYHGLSAQDVAALSSVEQARALALREFTLDSHLDWKRRSVPVGLVRDFATFARTPWFLACNKARYPAWWGHADPREARIPEVMRAPARALTPGFRRLQRKL